MAPDRNVVFTDGACSGNPGPGGWAWAVPDGPFAAGAEARTTNQRMEITAAFEAVKANGGPLEVVSDSTYVVNCFRDHWYDGWKKRGWLNTARKPVANRDLWEPFIELVLERGDVAFRWVKGHGGDPMNEVVDRLAVEAALTQQPRAGDRTPDTGELGPEDLGTGRDARLPSGHLVLIGGHRPPELGGYDANPIADDVRRRLREILEAKRELHADLVVVTGLLLGAEQLGAEAAHDVGIPYVAVLPYPTPDSMWPEAARAHFDELVRHAEGAIVLERKIPETKQKAGAALARRDGWLVRQVDEAIVVWDGTDATVGKLVRNLEPHVGDDVWIVNP